MKPLTEVITPQVVIERANSVTDYGTVVVRMDKSKMSTAIRSIDGTTELAIDAVIFREELYPRLNKQPALVQTYEQVLDLLPPIEVNQKNELLDGWHRWMAHRKAGRETIAVIVTHTETDLEAMEIAVIRNATHGMQLPMADKCRLAQRMYEETPVDQQGGSKKKLASLFAVTERVVQQWTSRIDKDNREARDAAVFNLWLACYTEEKIAEDVGMSQVRIHEILSENERFRLAIKPGILAEIEDDDERAGAIEKLNRDAATHKTDFKPPIYNIWKQQEKTAGVEHFGKFKPHTIIQGLARRTQPVVPAYVVLYTPSATCYRNQQIRDIHHFRVKRVWPNPQSVFNTKTPEEFAEFLIKVRNWSTLQRQQPKVPTFVFEQPRLDGSL